MIRPLEIQRLKTTYHSGPCAIVVVLLCLFATGCGQQQPAPEATTSFERERFEEGLRSIETWLARGKPDKAEVIARRLVTLEPDSVEALEAHGRCLVILGALKRSQGSDSEATQFIKQADECYQAAVHSAGASPRVSLLHEAGITASSTGDYERALGLHSRAAELDPTNTKHAIFAGNLLTRLERPEESARWFQQATERDPNEPWGWAGLAEANRQMKAYDAALTTIRQARACDPSNTNFRIAEARILRESSRGREAAMLLFAIGPDERANRPVTEALVAACTQIGDHRRAAEAWQALHAKHPEDLDAMLEAASAWLLAGEREQAAAWLEAAESSGASPAKLQSIREKLRPEAP